MPKKGGKKHNRAKPKGGPPKLPDAKTTPANEVVAAEQSADETKIQQTPEAVAAAVAAAASGSTAAPEKDVTAAPVEDVFKEAESKPTVEAKKDEVTLPVREKDAATEKLPGLWKPVKPAETLQETAAKPAETLPEIPAAATTEAKPEAKPEPLAAVKPTETPAVTQPETPVEKAIEKTTSAEKLAEKPADTQPKEQLLQESQAKVAQPGGPQGKQTALETGALGAAVGTAGVAGTAAVESHKKDQPEEKIATKEANGHVSQAAPTTGDVAHVKRSHEEPLFAITDRDQPPKKARVDEGTQPTTTTAAAPTTTVQEPAMSATLAEPFSQAAILSPSSAPVSAEQQAKPEIAPVQKETISAAQAEKREETPVASKGTEPTAQPVNPAVTLPAEPKPAAKPVNGKAIDQEPRLTDKAAEAKPAEAQKEAKKGGFMSWIKRKFKGDKATA